MHNINACDAVGKRDGSDSPSGVTTSPATNAATITEPTATSTITGIPQADASETDTAKVSPAITKPATTASTISPISEITPTIRPTSAAKQSWRDVLKIHPAAEMFPPMSPDELRALGDDIRVNGLANQVALFSDGSLVDGRSRLDAMELAGIKVDLHEHATYPHIEDPYAYVISANIHRRHLTAEQKRDITAKLLKAKPESSNVAISKQVKVDDKTVAKVRRALETTSEIPRLEKTVGADGKARKKPAKKRRRTEDDFRKDIAAKKGAVPEPPVEPAGEVVDKKRTKTRARKSREPEPPEGERERAAFNRPPGDNPLTDALDAIEYHSLIAGERLLALKAEVEAGGEAWLDWLRTNWGRSRFSVEDLNWLMGRANV